jgi:hypothetical protein
MKFIEAVVVILLTALAQAHATTDLGDIAVTLAPFEEDVSKEVTEEALEEAVEKVVDEVVAQQIANIEELNVYEGPVNIYEFAGDEAQPQFIVVSGGDEQSAIPYLPDSFMSINGFSSTATATAGKAGKLKVSSSSATATSTGGKAGKAGAPVTNVSPYAGDNSIDLETVDAGKGLFSFLSSSTTTAFATSATLVAIASSFAGVLLC